MTQLDLARPAGLLLDLDGTLLDTEPLHIQAHIEALAAFGVAIEAEEILANVGGHDRDFYHDLQRRRDLSGDVEAWVARKDALLMARYAAGAVALRPGVAALLDRAQEIELPCCVVTNSMRQVADLVLDSSPLGSRLPRRVCFEDTVDHKPHPAPYRLGAERLGAAPTACWAVEDSVPGVRSATTAGARTIACSGLVPDGDLRAAGAWRTVADLEEVLPWLR